MQLTTLYNVTSYKRGGYMVAKSRAEYFRERRKTRKQFVVMLDKEEYEKLEKHIKSQGKTNVDWFREVIRKELGLKKK